MAIVDSIMNLLTPQLTSAFADKLGVSIGEAQSGVGSSVAAILAGIGQRVSDHSFVNQIFQLVRSVPTAGVLTTLANLASGADVPSAVEGQVSQLTSLVMDDPSRVERVIALRSGLTADSGHALMSLAGTLTAGYLGRLIRDSSLSVAGFVDVIRAETSHLRALLPSGMSIVPPAAGAAMGAGSSSSKGNGTLFWALIGTALLAVVIFLVGRGLSKPSPLDRLPDDISAPAPATNPSLGAFGTRTLADGTLLNIPANGIENKLLDFVADASKPIDKSTWFDFDRITFDTGEATLRPDSGEQLENIAAILKAYPTVKVKVGGYTDNTGSAASNLALSQRRADTVRQQIIQRGIDGTRLEAEGYGENYPIADNSTPEGKQINRRISLRVTAK